MITPKAERSSANLIAPCGINCRLCRAYGRKRNPCPGCRAAGMCGRTGCIRCLKCEKLQAGLFQYCFECDTFPCKRLEHLDWRYRTRYATSPIENLERIRASGIRAFVRSENEKWACPACGAMLSMHIPQCAACGYVWHPAEREG